MSMNELAATLAIGITAFVATNIDDIVVLALFFSQVNEFFRPCQVVIGQYLGFGVLLLASLPGFFGSFFVQKEWLGLLGLLPILIGITHLAQWHEDNNQIQAVSGQDSNTQPRGLGLLNRQTYSVAAVTVANGADNIGIYVPLFARSNWWELLVLLGVFLVLVGVWCFVSYHLTRYPAITQLLSRYGHRLFPFVLIGLGFYILLESGTLKLLR